MRRQAGEGSTSPECRTFANPSHQQPRERASKPAEHDQTRRARSSVRLSPAEREIAAASGMSPVDYAKQKLQLAELKKQGHYNEP